MESNNYSIRDLIYYWMNHPSHSTFQIFIKNHILQREVMIYYN